jgi:hypothetical protein
MLPVRFFRASEIELKPQVRYGSGIMAAHRIIESDFLPFRDTELFYFLPIRRNSDVILDFVAIRRLQFDVSGSAMCRGNCIHAIVLGI